MFRTLVALLISFNLLGQSDYSTVGGNVGYLGGDLLENVSVFLLSDNDTLGWTLSDSLGHFDFDIPLEIGKEYKIWAENPNGFNDRPIKFGDGAAYATKFFIELRFLRATCGYMDNTAYFDLNEVKKYSNFHADIIRQLTIDHPNICLHFWQTIPLEENERVAKKRMKLFRKELLKYGIPEDNFQCTDVVHQEKTKNGRARIDGIVMSVEEKCK